MLGRRFEHQKVNVGTVIRHNLGAVDHLAPNKMYKLIKCEFPNTELMNDARRTLERILKANRLRVSHLDHLDDNDPFKEGVGWSSGAKRFLYVIFDQDGIGSGADPMDSIIGLFEYDLIHVGRPQSTASGIVLLVRLCVRALIATFGVGSGIRW